MAFIGADPEFFIVDSKNNPVPAWLIFPPCDDYVTIFKRLGEDGGSTGDYLRVSELTDKQRGVTNSSMRKIFRDGYVVEFNVAPATCRQVMAGDMCAAFKIATYVLRAKEQALGYPQNELKFSSQPCYPVDLAALAEMNANGGMPDDVKLFGCSPSLNVYEGGESMIREQPLELPLRFAGGHMHLSENTKAIAQQASHPFHSEEAMEMYVRLMDLYVGLPLTYIFDGPAQFERRKYYGKAGEYRIQKYGKNESGAEYVGVEYRTPPPQVFNSGYSQGLAYGAMHEVLVNFQEYAKAYDFGMAEAIQNAINTGEGVYPLLRTVPRMYSPELLKSIKKHKNLTDFQFARSKRESGGWGLWNAGKPQDEVYSYAEGYRWEYEAYGEWRTWPGLTLPDNRYRWRERKAPPASRQKSNLNAFKQGLFTGSFVWYDSGLTPDAIRARSF